MEEFTQNIQDALDSKTMKSYGKLTVLLNNARRSGLITHQQLEVLDGELEQLRLGRNESRKYLDSEEDFLASIK